MRFYKQDNGEVLDEVGNGLITRSTTVASTTSSTVTVGGTTYNNPTDFG